MSDNITLERSVDADLLTRVGIALTLRLRHTLHAVHIHVDQGTVTLRGLVPSFYDRQLAIEVTRRVAGVQRVLDELTVAGQSREDTGRRIYDLRESAVASAPDGAGTEPAPRSSSSSVVRQLRHTRGWRSLFSNAATVLRSLFLATLAVPLQL